MKHTEADIKKWKEFYDRAQMDVAKQLYDSVVRAALEISKLIDTKELDIVDDNYQKSLFEFLKTGKTLPAGIKAAQIEAYGIIEEDKSGGLADRRK